MSIRHHLSDPLLMAYAAGSLPEAFEAMRAAQGEPRSASAGVSPFGAPVAK